ncbi:hypothetical protein [Kitasatospora sp. NPDC088548]|uniref:hypothetical protein n=1 Tax=Kitasatospora sp. NPDC088548 TaxID=3364075 RepID=UPI00380E1B05
MRDWAEMQPDDFDQDVPTALFQVTAPPPSVPAVPDDYGTEALFGAPATPKRRPTRRPATPPPNGPALF